ncbi:MAG TPA: DUF2188 domain-containing protein [Verrucomicrobiales bacterium]|jgi:hypothetical protein|nr:DUF2188 domain-containing protein [Verrucomicrobiales bacterium]
MHQYQLKQEGGRWTLIAEGSDRAICTFESKKGALACCLEFARTRSGLVAVLRRDGRIERRLYPSSFIK